MEIICKESMLAYADDIVILGKTRRELTKLYLECWKLEKKWG